jgi:hypothetical protein
MKTKSVVSALAEPLKFIARFSKMGEKKLVLYIPLEYHDDIKKRWGKKRQQVKVTIEDAV